MLKKLQFLQVRLSKTQIISDASYKVGSQSVVGVIDIKRTGFFKKPEVVVLNGTVRTGLDPVSLAKQFQELGVGEIVLNFVDRDGKMNGYDLRFNRFPKNIYFCPLTVIGGAGKYRSFKRTYLEKWYYWGSGWQPFCFQRKI